MSKQNISNLDVFKRVFILGGTSEIAQEICLNLVKKGTKRIHFVSRNIRKINLFIERLSSEFNLEITYQEYDLLNEDFEIYLM